MDYFDYKNGELFTEGVPVDTIAAEVERLAGRLRDMLGEIPGVRVCDIGRRKCGIVTFTLDGIASEEVERRLREANIHVSCSLPNSTLIDATRRGLPEIVRASVHYFNLDDELARCADEVLAIAAG